MSLRVFVYGTLKPGEINYQRYCTGHVTAAIPAYTQGRLYHLNLGYPALAVGNDRVYGYCLSFTDDHILVALDQLEDYQSRRGPQDNEYNRIRQVVYDMQGDSLGLVWLYQMEMARIQAYQGDYLPGGQWSPNEFPLEHQTKVDSGQS
ncbi:gamma-glutamylcyclotransferase [Synechocystis sp. LKSZ1]|uniref:gamma-glutamylcyclotransferase family protein n=1 Tax=Synechocystis sp. LKSZ1 TaxID=3144951 RepID=UPI00336C1B5A